LFYPAELVHKNMQAYHRIPNKLLWIGRVALGLTLCLESSLLLAQPNAYVIQARPIISAAMLGGTVIPAKEVTLSAQVPGRIEKISGEEGSSFKENAVLISISTEELLAQRRSAMAEFASADSALRNAGVRYQQELFTPDSIKKAPGGMGLPFLLDEMMTEPMSEMLGKSDTKLDRRTNLHNFGTQIDQARSALMRARSQIDAIDAKLRDAHGLAPFDGIITKKLVEIGDTVQPGVPLLKFADTSSLQIQVEVPSRLASGLQTGMVLNAKLDVGGWVQVRIAQVFPIADAQRHTVTVKFDLPPNTRAGAGQYAQVEIQDVNTPAKYMPIIPTAAIVWRGSLPGVYVLNNGKRELRLLRLGNNYGQEVAVLSGLKSGETIEVNPAPGTTSGWVSPNQNGNDSAH
jgi:multidrug efflux pump subunit AcrA (membrane-fusion protein)